MNIADKLSEFKKEMETRNIPTEKRPLIMTVFMDSYAEHRKIYGSFKGMGEGYEEKMEERYQWMKERAYRIVLGSHDN